MWQAWWSWGRYPKIAEYFQVTLVEALPGLLTMFLISKDLVIYRPYGLSECKQSNNNFRVRTLATWGGPMTAIVNRNDTCCCWNPTCWATCCDCDAWIVAWDGMFLRSLWCWALACPQCGALSEVQQICWQLGVHRLFTSFAKLEDHPSILRKMLLNALRCDFDQGLYVQDHLKNQGVEIKLPLGFSIHLISTCKRDELRKFER